jgi:hypothetical protein
LPPIFKLSIALHERFNLLVAENTYFKKNSFNIEFIRGDLLKKEFGGGTIFFLNATCFRDDDWVGLQAKLSSLAEGTRIIIVTRQLDDVAFELIESGTYPMSWGPSSVYVYRKIR